MSSPAIAMTVIYWLHMLATVIWIGGLAALVLLVIPAARRSLDAAGFAALMGALQQRLDPLGWFCLALLVGTGMFQMSSNPHYNGFLAIDSTWAAAILLKHGLFLIMTGASAYLTWGVLPALRRAALKVSLGQPAPDLLRLERRNLLLMRLNLLLALLVLALTALARAS